MMKSRNNGTSRYSPITQEAMWLETLVVILQITRIDEVRGRLKYQ
ncbi:MAG: hypothetical protein ACYSUX_03380 [Planctomycetota bacterium]